MKNIVFFSLALAFPATSLADGGHKRSPVKIEFIGKKQFDAGTVNFAFNILNSKKIVTPQNLEIVHEKKLHMLVFDKSLTQFFHVHPEFKQKSWTVSANIPVSGTYKVFVEGKQKKGEEFSLQESVQIKNGAPELPQPTQITPAASGSAGESTVSLSTDTFSSTSDSHIVLTFSRTDGKKPKITDYLGAKAHVILTPLDGSELLHVHPMEGSENTLGLHTRFPKAGDYRMWVEFIDNNVKRTVPLWVRARAETQPSHQH